MELELKEKVSVLESRLKEEKEKNTGLRMRLELGLISFYDLQKMLGDKDPRGVNSLLKEIGIHNHNGAKAKKVEQRVYPLEPILKYYKK